MRRYFFFIFFLLSFLPLVSSAESTSFENLITSGNITFDGFSNRTFYLNVSNGANFTNAYLNITGSLSDGSQFRCFSYVSFWDLNASSTPDPVDLHLWGVNLTITDDSASEIIKYNIDGTQIYTYDTGTELSQPFSITENGTTYFIPDYTDDRMYVQNLTGANITNWTLHADNDQPRGVATDGNNIYVVDNLRDEIYNYSMNGVYQSSCDVAVHDISNPTALTLYNDSFMILNSDDNRVYKLDKECNYEYNFSIHANHTSPKGITWNGTSMYIMNISADPDEVMLYDSIGCYPYNAELFVGGVSVWDSSGEFSIVNNKTNNFTSVLNDAVSNGLCDCQGCLLGGGICKIPFTFHSDGVGKLGYGDMHFLWTPNSVEGEGDQGESGGGGGGVGELLESWNPSGWEKLVQSFEILFSGTLKDFTGEFFNFIGNFFKFVIRQPGSLVSNGGGVE